MKIEVLETFLDGKTRFEGGETRVVSEEDGQYFCSLGWARDVEGTVPTGERQKTGEVRLDIRSSKVAVIGGQL